MSDKRKAKYKLSFDGLIKMHLTQSQITLIYQLLCVGLRVLEQNTSKYNMPSESIGVMGTWNTV